MVQRANRRDFLQRSAAAGIGFWVAGGVEAAQSASPNEKIGMASIGVDGKGQSDSGDADSHGQLVAICDVDEKKLDAAAKRFPKAKKYVDFRKMLDEMGKSIDAVTVSTPDHVHAVASVTAMRMRKHCFCQKPLTRTIQEARVMGQVAREMKVATQMGNQGTANDGLRRAAALLRKNALGKVSQVHVWTDRPIWPQGGNRPAPAPVPKELHWDLWLGPAPFRPYGLGYHPFSWRGWWAFGTGALGDMACHTLNMPYAGLELRDPISVEAETSPDRNVFSYPKWSVIKFEFPANSWRGPLTLTWYDGGKRVSKELLNGKDPSKSGAVIVGEKGKLYAPGDYCDSFEILGKVDLPKVEFQRGPNHFEEWTRAIRGGPAAMSNFHDYSGPLTETILLGNLAVWAAGNKVEWDAKNLQVKNHMPEVEHVVRGEYRKGYSL